MDDATAMENEHFRRLVHNAVRWVANAFAFLGFVVSLPLWFAFDFAAESFQFREEAAWIR